MPSSFYLLDGINTAQPMTALRERRPGFARGVIFRWISAHSGVPGNEKADAEAKKAATGRSSRAELLPPFLRKALPRSATTTKRLHREAVMVEWKTRRGGSTRIERMNRIDPDFSPSGFQKLIKSLNRNESTLINRLRSNHLPLNAFLHRILRGDSPTCSKCNNADETIRHYLFECAAYRPIRRETLDGLGRNSRETRFLLSTKKGIEAVLRYVKATKRMEPDDRAGIG